jgi:photosystem II stability/assembly factor-like uncharacterized protein
MAHPVMHRRRLLQALLAALGGGPAAAAVPELDPLAHAATLQPRAATGVLLALGRAGSRLVAVGERGTILLSDDEGRAWRQVPAPVSVSLTGVSFADERLGWIVGHGQVVLHTRDGGHTWARQLDGRQVAQLELAAAQAAGDADAVRTAERWVKEGADKPFLDVHFFDARHGLAIGAYGSVIATDDGGATWRSRRADVPNPGARHLYRVHVDGDTVWLCGEQGLLVRAAGRDTAFTPVKTPYAGSFFGMASLPRTLLVYGLRGNLWRSTDAGAEWRRVPLPAPVTVTGAAVLSGGRVVLVDEAGKLLLSTDGGAGFQTLSMAKAAAFTDAVATRDGAVVLASTRGPVRLQPQGGPDGHAAAPMASRTTP